MVKKENDFSNIDPNTFNNQYNLKFLFVSSSGREAKKYEGFVDTILDFGVGVKTKDTCAKGHNIVFKIAKEDKIILEGTGRIDHVSDLKDDEFKYIVCVFNQFDEQSKKILQKEAQLNQDNIKNYMDDLN